jgi:hypothetical protein
MYAIMNDKLEFLYNTDFRWFPYQQCTSRKQALTYETKERACADLKLRCCGPNYHVVKVKMEIQGW